MDIPTLTAEKIPINLSSEIIKPSTVKRIPGYGLPQPKEPTKRGDILVSFDIQFPDKLTQTTKDKMFEMLPTKWWENYQFPEFSKSAISQNLRIPRNSVYFGKFVELTEIKNYKTLIINRFLR